MWPKSSLYPWDITLVLLAAALLRWHGLATMEGMLLYDEAYNVWDTLKLIASPRLTPFLTANFGRESGWHYLLLPFLIAFGVRPLAVHLLAGTVSLLTVAALYRLGKELFDHETGLGSAAALTVLYWHVHIGHIGLRANLYPLVGMLATIGLLYGRRTGSWPSWLSGGFWLGALMYTYFSARLWLAYIGLWLLLPWFFDQRQRTARVTAAGIALLVALPQLIYIWRFPGAAWQRMDSVAVVSLPVIGAHLLAWLNAWTIAGDPRPHLNWAQQPILDLPLVVLALAGLLRWLRQPRAEIAIWSFGLAAVSIIPSLLSDGPPHYLRALGLVVPLCLLIGFGAAGIRRLLSARWPALAPVGVGFVLLCLTLSGFNSYSVFAQWLQSDQLLMPLEMHINEAAHWLEESMLPDDPRPLYFSPFSPYHPNVAILAYRFAPRPVGAFDANHCLVIADEPALLVNVPALAPETARRLEGLARLTPLHQATRQMGGRPLYEIFEVRPAFNLPLNDPANSPVFNDSLRVQFTSPPETAAAGDLISLALFLRAEAAQSKVYSAFIHLHGDPSPYAGGPIWANSSAWLCEPYPAPEWQAGEVVVQPLALAIPANMPAGRYELALGLFESPDGPRLTLTAPYTHHDNYFIMGELWITE